MSSTPKCSLNTKSVTILELPVEILQEILSYLSFHTISEIRLVCTAFDNACRLRLNQGFTSISKQHAEIQRKVKSQLPRRESDRRKHSLARHVDILSAVETRLSLLSMTYMKYIDNNIACFIPGKVLDELQRILRVVAHFNDTPRAHEFLQELRDISSMAMEHFEDKIASSLKLCLPSVSSSFNDNDLFMSPSSSPVRVDMYTKCSSRYSSVGSDVHHLQQQACVQNNCIQTCKQCIGELRNKILQQSKQLSEQQKIIVEQKSLLNEQVKKTNEITKRLSIVESCLTVESASSGNGNARTSSDDLLKPSGARVDLMSANAVDDELSSSVTRRSTRIRRKGQKRSLDDVCDEGSKRRKK